MFCFSPEKKLIAEYLSIPAASAAVGISASIISQELNKEIKTLSGGFYWSKEKELKQVKNYKNNGKSKSVN